MISLDPIGTVRCLQKWPYEVPRQGALADNVGQIVLRDEARLRQGLAGLEGFARVWVVYVFHHNSEWRPLVQTPTEGAARQGVFATRSPYRPNPIGMSCVELVGITDGVLTMANHDLLDGTPVLDIKPYLPYADAFADSAAGWTDTREERVYSVSFAELARSQADWILEHAQLAIFGFVAAQLTTHPTSAERKRVTQEGDGWVIAYRTWRLAYTVDEAAQEVHVLAIWSGYTEGELAASEDSYEDKAVHRAFGEIWGDGRA